MKNFIPLFFTLALLSACANEPAAKPPVDSTPQQQSLKNATIEELIVEFQSAIPDSLRTDVEDWNSWKAKTPAQVWDTAGDGHQTPGTYCAYLSRSLKKSAYDTTTWGKDYAGYDWEESMFTNYEKGKCARLLLKFATVYLDTTKLDATWKRNRMPEWKTRMEELGK